MKELVAYARHSSVVVVEHRVPAVSLSRVKATRPGYHAGALKAIRMDIPCSYEEEGTSDLKCNQGAKKGHVTINTKIKKSIFHSIRMCTFFTNSLGKHRDYPV